MISNKRINKMFLPSIVHKTPSIKTMRCALQLGETPSQPVAFWNPKLHISQCAALGLTNPEDRYVWTNAAVVFGPQGIIALRIAPGSVSSPTTFVSGAFQMDHMNSSNFMESGFTFPGWAGKPLPYNHA